MPTIRGSSITASSAGSYTIPFPLGSIVGDTAFLFVGGGWQVSTPPSGWTVLDAHPGSNWNGSLYARLLTLGDITTGSVSFTMGGTFDTVIAMVVYAGAVNWRTVTASQNGSGSASIALAATAAVQATDHVLLFGSNRANSVDTVDKGTGVVTISGGSGGNASGVVTEYVPGSAGAFTANFAYATAGSGNYQVTLPLVDAGSTLLQVADSVRETLGSGTAALNVAAVVRETLAPGTSALKVAAVVREVLRSSTTGATQLQAAVLVREVLMSSTVAALRRRQLINPM